MAYPSLVNVQTPHVLAHIDSTDLYKTGHMANRWFGKVSRRLSVGVRAAAPRRTGQMRRRIHTTKSAVPRERKMQIVLVSGAPYTMFVLRGTGYPGKGTAGLIFTTMGFAQPNKDQGGWFLEWIDYGNYWPMPRYIKGMVMAFGPDQYGPRIITPEVYGQRPDNFLHRGWTYAAHYHRSLRPVPHFVRNP